MSDEQKDSTWSVKATSQLKKEVDTLIDQSPLNAKEFFEQLIQLYRRTQLEGSEAEKSQDIQQVTYHLDKIRNLFLAVIEKEYTLQEGYTEWMKKESETHKQIVDDIQRQKVKAEDDRDKAKAETVIVNDTLIELSTRNQELESTNKTQRVTIEILEQKIGEVDARVEECINIEEKNIALIDEMQSLEKRLELLSREHDNSIKDQNVIVETLKKELEQSYLLKEAQEKESMKTMDQLKQIYQLEKDKAIIETEKCSLELVQRIKDEYGTKIESLTNKNQELLETIQHVKDEYQSRIEEMQTKEKNKK